MIIKQSSVIEKFEGVIVKLFHGFRRKMYYFMVLILLFPCLTHAGEKIGDTSKNFWLKNDDVLSYIEAISLIKDNLLLLNPSITRKQIIQETIKSYLRKLDLYSDYMTPDEYAAFRESQKNSYVGIGMEIGRYAENETICIPYPGSPAEKAGIRIGDRLVSIDGIKVEGISLYTVAAKARGRKDTNVVLTVLNKNGFEEEIGVIRSDVKIESVSKRWLSDIAVIQIFSFTNNTQRELKYILKELKDTEPLILDLRGNPGGDLYSAIDSSMLFLEKGKKIVSIVTNKGITPYLSYINPVNPISPIYIWQDERTASAAEVFIAALIQNRRAVSIGKKTFGKGTKQDIIEVNNGAALILTTGYLQTPDETKYDGKGIEPVYPLTDPYPQTRHYLMKVEALAR